LVGITFKYYQRLESGAVLGIRLSSVEKITKAYGIDLETFFSKRKPKVRKFKVPPPPHRKPKSRLSGHLTTLRTFTLVIGMG